VTLKYGLGRESKKQLCFLQILLLLLLLLFWKERLVERTQFPSEAELAPGSAAAAGFTFPRHPGAPGASGDATVKPTPRSSQFSPVFLPNHT